MKFLERIDPYNSEVKVTKTQCLMHLNRYRKILPFAEQKNVLDAGCGYGYGTKMIASKAKKVVALDISKEAIEYARKKYNSRNIEYICEDLNNINLSNFDKSDIAIIFEVLEHINNPQNIIRKLRQNMNLGGYLFLSVPNGKRINDSNPFHVNKFDKNEIIDLLGDFFNVEKIYYQNPCFFPKFFNDLREEKDRKSLFSTIESIPFFKEFFSRIYKKDVGCPRGLYFIAKAI